MKTTLKTLSNVLATAMVIALVVIGVLFSLQNQELVNVNLLLFAPIEQTVAFWLLASFSVGILVSLLVFSLLYLRTQKRNMQLTLKVRSLQRQLDNQQTPK